MRDAKLRSTTTRSLSTAHRALPDAELAQVGIRRGLVTGHLSEHAKRRQRHRARTNVTREEPAWNCKDLSHRMPPLTARRPCCGRSTMQRATRRILQSRQVNWQPFETASWMEAHEARHLVHGPKLLSVSPRVQNDHACSMSRKGILPGIRSPSRCNARSTWWMHALSRKTISPRMNQLWQEVGPKEQDGVEHQKATDTTVHGMVLSAPELNWHKGQVSQGGRHAQDGGGKDPTCERAAEIILQAERQPLAPATHAPVV